MVVRVDTEAERRLAALSLVREGRLYDLGRVLDERAPVFPGRHFRQPLVPNAMPVGSLNWVTDIVSTTTQVGTHLDALCHLPRTGGSTAATGSPTWPGPPGSPSTGSRRSRRSSRAAGSSTRAGSAPATSSASTRSPAIDPEPGDAVLFHTGWGAALGRRGERTCRASPGPGCAVAEWLAERGVALTGCDTWSYGPVPAEDPERPFEVPQILNVRHGVFIVENLDLSALAADGVRRVRADPHPPQAARRHRRVDLADRPRLTEEPWTTTT